jgi:hypothetical protein
MDLDFDDISISQVVSRIVNWQPGQHEGVIVPFVESIFELYLKSDGDDRKKIREAVRANRTLWNFAGRDDIGVYLSTLGQYSGSNIVPYLRAWLICISITGGVEWRDTLAIIESLYNEAVLQHVDIRPHVEEIAASADDSDSRGVMEMSTRDLILWVLRAQLNVNREELLQRKQEREAARLAEQEWGGKLRSCPKCSTAFKSNFDLGQCPQCGKRFHASRSSR